jgi:hypothetical protein
MHTIDTENCVRSMTIMASGDLDELARVVHPQAVNREAKDEPPPAAARAGRVRGHRPLAASRVRGSGFDVHDAVADGDLIAVHCTMSGRQVGPFVAYDERGEVAQAFPPTGRTFAITQSHWFRMQGRQVVEHWANRDDLGMATQLGWVPPTPAFLWRMARARRHARRNPIR